MTSKKIFAIIILIQAFVSIDAQTIPVFNDSLIFNKWGVHNSPYCVQYLGDQNNDGYDDFLISNFNNPTGSDAGNDYIVELYHGGHTIDTIPYLKFHCYGFLIHSGAFVGTVDMNGDGYRDIVFLKDTVRPYKLSVLFGGPTMDTIPDMFISLPSGAQIMMVDILNRNGNKIDFDGDGIEELAFMLWEGEPPGPQGAVRDVFIVKTGTKYTGELNALVKTKKNARDPFAGTYISIADLDGDNCSDIFLLNVVYSDSTWQHYLYDAHTVFYGDSNLIFDRKVDMTYFQEMTFLLPDMNHDGKGEFLAYDRRGIGAPTYNSYITNGSCPPDTMPPATPKKFYYDFPLGGPIRPIGDINGDGYNDIIVTGRNMAQPYIATVYLGGQSYYIGSTSMYGYGLNMVGRIGDINGDGCEDILIGEYDVHANLNGQPGFVKIYAGKRIAMAVEETNKIEDKQVELTCYPNPTTGEIKVVYSLPQNVNNAFLSLYDMLGKEIKHIELQPSNGKKEVSINLKEENISSGVYVANIRYHEKGELKNRAIKIQYVK